MIQFVPFTFQDHGQWVKERMPIIFQEDTRGIVALRDGEPVAALLAENWTVTSCCVHMVVLDPLVLRHRMHYEFCEWVFNQTGRIKMYGIIPDNNEKSKRLCRHFGFKETHRFKDAYDHGVDNVVFEYRRGDCKYFYDIKEAA